MLLLRFISLCALAVAPLLLAGCSTPAPLAMGASELTEPYRVGSGDEVRVVVFEQPSLTNVYRVDQVGGISMPLIGYVAAEGSTTRELGARIEATLASSYLREPDVSVEVASYRPIFVLGEVGNSGQVRYVPGMTAEAAIAVAGGFAEGANMRVIRISRTVRGTVYEAPAAATEPIMPGDTIYVTRWRLFGIDPRGGVPIVRAVGA